LRLGQVRDDDVKNDRDKRNTAPPPAAFLGLGLTWVISTGLFLYLGSLLDARWGTKPVFSLIGAFVGAVAGFYYLYHQAVVRPRERQKAQEEQQKRERGDQS